MAKRAVTKKSPDLKAKKPILQAADTKLSLRAALERVDWKKFMPKSSNQILVALLVIASFLIGVLFTKVQYLEKGSTTGGTQQAAVPSQTAQPNAPAAGAKVNVALGHFPVKGDAKAKVTIVEFADFRCPFCEQFFTNTEPQIFKDYVDTGKVKYAFRNFAFLGPASVTAADASECANDQGKFWEYYDYLFTHQNGENQGNFSNAYLKSFAKELGLK